MGIDISVLAAFGAGVLSFLSPCVLPMIPVYFASLYGPEIFHRKSGKLRITLFLHSLSFVLGFSAIYTALGAIVGVTGYAVNLSSVLLYRIAGIFLIAFGAFLIAAMKISWLNFEKRFAPPLGSSTGFLRSLLIGGTFSLAWVACVGPILGGILALAAAKATAWEGASLLLVYCLGLGLPFLVMGAAFDTLIPLLRRLQRFSRGIQLVSGILLIFFGILSLTGNMIWFASLGG